MAMAYSNTATNSASTLPPFSPSLPLSLSFVPSPLRPPLGTIWEVVHKGGGWIAVILGIVNVCLGVAVSYNLNYDMAVVGLGAAFAAIGIGGCVLFFIATTISPHNPWAVCCVGGGEAAPMKQGNGIEVT